MRRVAGATAAVLVAAVLLAACGVDPPHNEAAIPSSAAGGSGVSAAPSGDVELEAVDASAREEGPSALDDIGDERLPEPLVDPDRIKSGGPPPDGIPAIDDPRFQAVSAVDWLDDSEGVLSLTVDGQTRAYPIQVLIWHEIVNDTIAGRPVSVTYCPLCNSALAFDRRVDPRLLSFGTSGSLYLSDLVMYDRQTESLWSQIEGRAIAGRLTGTQLTRLPVATVTWKQWRDANPEGWVLARPTDSGRAYGSNPYEGYDEPSSQPFLFDGDPDDRLPPKERVVALLDGPPLAVLLSLVADRRVVDLGQGRDAVVLGAPGLRSALDAAEVRTGQVIPATGVFVPRAGGRRLTFRASGPVDFVDEQTKSTWNILGEAVAGPLRGQQLARAQHVDTFWFAWAAFRPDTQLVR